MLSSGTSSQATASAASSAGTRTRDRFALSGQSATIDRRVDAVRPDLADIRVAARVFAPHYARAIRRTAARPVLIRGGEAADAPALSQILPGEPFDVLEVAPGHMWGIAPIDGVVGYVDPDALIGEYPTGHVVTAAVAKVHAHANPDSAVLAHLPMGTRVAATAAGDAMFEVDGGYVAADALTALSDLDGDPVTIAERLLGAPTLPGGRSGAGVDAGGLVALCWSLVGHRVPRLVDLLAGHGDAVDPQAVSRGDLACFAGHVAMVVDGDRAIHATPDGKVEYVALDTLIDTGRFGPVLAWRRIA